MVSRGERTLFLQGCSHWHVDHDPANSPTLGFMKAAQTQHSVGYLKTYKCGSGGRCVGKKSSRVTRRGMKDRNKYKYNQNML